MNEDVQEVVAKGLEPVSGAEALALPTRPRQVSSSVRLNIRGRSVRLRGLRRTPTGMLRWLFILGPGLVAASAGNDAGGIATYSSTGARHGYELIWVMLLVTVSLSVVQEMCARLGAATGRGLLDLIRERFGLGWAIFAVAVVLVANGGLVISEFVGIGAAAELFGISKYIAVPLAALVVWYLVVYGNYGSVEKVFLLMTLVFFAYPAAALLARPDWGAVARGAFVPTVHLDAQYIFLLVGLLGTTITPYMQLFQQSSIVEKGGARRHYGPERIDAYAGAVFSNRMSIAMSIAAAATLHAAGKTEIETAADAARALEPVAGRAAFAIFGIGLLGASLLAAAVLPLATAYAVSEAFGFAKGVNLDFRRARTFFSLFTALIIGGAVAALIPYVPVISLLVVIQVLNGVLLPIILVFILLLINDERLTGELKNTRLYNFLGWGTFALVSLAVAVMFG
ncbi:MAG TPA: Nramp family divalent metal transporter, partial [Pyrinomonadaceae bacterium]|nr:Nramp family divalent metal transporter [Pyrinomonadaceae bacterium]